MLAPELRLALVGCNVDYQGHCQSTSFLQILGLSNCQGILRFLCALGSCQAGVRAGWTLKRADGKVVTKTELREVAPPVELEFQRHLDDLMCPEVWDGEGGTLG